MASSFLLTDFVACLLKGCVVVALGLGLLMLKFLGPINWVAWFSIYMGLAGHLADSISDVTLAVVYLLLPPSYFFEGLVLRTFLHLLLQFYLLVFNCLSLFSFVFRGCRRCAQAGRSGRDAARAAAKGCASGQSRHYAAVI